MASARRRRGIRGPLRTGLRQQGDADWLRRRALGFVRQSLIALGVFGLVVYVGVIGPPYAAAVEKVTRYAATTDYGYDEVVAWVVGLRDVELPRSWEEVSEVVRGWWAPEPETPGEEPGSWSLLPPAAGPITSGFGWRIHPIHEDLRYHTGVDIGAPEGSQVVAVREGTVKAVGEDDLWGKNVLIEHSPEQSSFYAHLAEVLVMEGAAVTRGQPIGTVGRTGSVKDAHLHFELREKGQPIDPEPLIRAAGGGI